MLPRATDDGFSCSEPREIIYYNMIYIIIIQTPVFTHSRMRFWFKFYFTAHLLLCFEFDFVYVNHRFRACLVSSAYISLSSQSFPINTYNLPIVYLGHYSIMVFAAAAAVATHDPRRCRHQYHYYYWWMRLAEKRSCSRVIIWFAF